MWIKHAAERCVCGMSVRVDKHLTILELHKIIDKHRLYIIDDKHI